MQVLLYNQLQPQSIPHFQKLKGLLEAGDFRSADVKKVGDNLYRARLDIHNRVLFSLYRSHGQTYILVLECIAHHAYNTSRFLRRGGTIDESKIPTVDHPEQAAAVPLAFINPQLPTFHLLNKVISFDDAQQAVYTLPPPCIVIGSAGSGKTALTLKNIVGADEFLHVDPGFCRTPGAGEEPSERGLWTAAEGRRRPAGSLVGRVPVLDPSRPGRATRARPSCCRSSAAAQTRGGGVLRASLRTDGHPRP